MFLQSTKDLRKKSLEEIKEEFYLLASKNKCYLGKLKGELGILIKTEIGDLKFKVSSNTIKEVLSFEEDLVYLEITQKDFLKLLSNPSNMTKSLLLGKIRIKGNISQFWKIVEDIFI